MMLVFVVLPLALLITTAAILGFVWAARSGQFDDVQTPAVRMLLDDPPACESDVPAPSRPSAQSRQ